MTRYDKVMQAMTPRKYAKKIYEDQCKCLCCAYYGTTNCRFAKLDICLNGITEWLESEVKENETD